MKSLNGAAVAALIAAVTAPAAFAQDAVQWRVEDGGNGHWYAKVTWSHPYTWEEARNVALATGADLVGISSAAEHLWISTSLGLEHEPCGGYRGWIIGGFQDFAAPDFSEPGGGWRWSNDEAWGWTNWAAHAPDNYSGTQHWLMMYAEGDWDDAHLGPGGSEPICRAIFEWSADCNGDGIVDYGQILDGTFEDANENGVPDCCEDGTDCQCLGDVNFDGQVNGADISVLLGFWGLTGKPNNADINRDGVVDGADLAALLGGWGECK